MPIRFSQNWPIVFSRSASCLVKVDCRITFGCVNGVEDGAGAFGGRDPAPGCDDKDGWSVEPIVGTEGRCCVGGAGCGFGSAEIPLTCSNW